MSFVLNHYEPLIVLNENMQIWVCLSLLFSMTFYFWVFIGHFTSSYKTYHNWFPPKTQVPQRTHELKNYIFKYIDKIGYCSVLIILNESKNICSWHIFYPASSPNFCEENVRVDLILFTFQNYVNFLEPNCW